MTELVMKGFDGLRRRVVRLDVVWLLMATIIAIVAWLDSGSLGAVIGIATSALGGTLPYIVVAVLLISYLKATGAESIVAKAFEGREHRMIMFAALLGGLAPFCSCEVIPFIAGLLALGAPLSAVMAFWLSSPLIDPPTVIITAGALGWEFAAGKAASAIFIGLLGGFGMSLAMRTGAFTSPLKHHKTGGCCATSAFKGRPVWRFWVEPPRVRVFRDETKRNALFLIKWLAFAYVLEGILITYVPAETIGSIVGGDGVGPIIIGALVGAPAYLNSYAAPALVAGLMEQGMSAGAAMAFMVAGAVSSIPAMAAVWSLVRPSVYFSYMGFGIGGAILSGMVFALFF